jgi:hypothetical protein
MRLSFFFLLISLPRLALSEVISTRVKEIDWGKKPNDSAMVLLSTGRVLWYPPEEMETLKRLEDAQLQRSLVLIDLKSKKIHSVIPASNEKLLKIVSGDEPVPYTPTVIGSDAFLFQLFQEARRTTRQETQCFNRAHIWSYEWRINHHVYSSKVWLFFTRKFIRKYKFEWWFHVAPLVSAEEGGKIHEKALDIKYAKTPLRLKEWTDLFIKDNADCPIITKYSDYADYPETGSCFVMKSSMYYYQPADLEDLELTGIQKMKWIRGEVQEAYREAFDHFF